MNRKGFVCVVLILFMFCSFHTIMTVSAWQKDKIATVTNIVDGDTFDVNTGERIRLADVDAPESWEDLDDYIAAKNYLSSKIMGKTVYLDIDSNYWDNTGNRVLCMVYIKYDSTHFLNINQALVDAGHAEKVNFDNDFNPPWPLYVGEPYTPPPQPSTSNKAPIVKIEGPKKGTTGSLIQFSGSASYDPDGFIVRYYWKFGDNKVSSIENPSHTYSEEGEYLITLSVKDNEGMTTIATTICTIANPLNKGPIVKINGPAIGMVNQTIHFTSIGTKDSDGNIINYYWQFGDNSFSTLKHPEHTYREAKKYQISLRVEDDDGAETIVNKYCTIMGPPNEKPIVYMDAPDFGHINEPIQFWSNGSYDPDGSLTQYIWSFGDGTVKHEQNPSHTYRFPSQYTVSLKVIDNSGESTSVSTICSVDKPLNLSPTVLMPGKYEGVTGDVINFNSNCSDDEFISEYLWNFGEGNSKKLSSTASYMYETEGNYTVTLTVTDDEGASNIASTLCTITSEGKNQGSTDYSGAFRSLSILSIAGMFFLFIKTRFQ